MNGKRPKEVISKNMSKIKSNNTLIERIIRAKLWGKGFRYRKNYSKLPGKPDIVFISEKIAVFCDSDFWHGRNWQKLKKRLTVNSDYWIPKIEKNKNRDKKINKELKKMGWTVLRYWESDIIQNTDLCVNGIIIQILKNRKANKKDI